MPLDTHDLAAQIAALARQLRGLDQEQVEAACDIAGDILSDDIDPRLEDDSLIDGIRWGHRAAITCERGGGVVLRIRAQGGKAVSHEWMHPVADLDLARYARLIEDAILPQVAS